MKRHPSFPIPLLLGALLSISLISVGCGSNPVGPGSNNIVTGPDVKVASKTIPPLGGILVVERSGDSLDGLTIEVPEGSYPDPRTVRVSTAPIISHEFGADFTFLTPLITISNGGGYADRPMTLTIPVKVPEGHFAMAFLYNRKTGELEGAPLMESTSDHVTVMLRSFSYSALPAFGRRAVGAADDDESKIVISSIDENKLRKSPYASDFRPGIDDWQFENLGSHLSPEGQCEGQSIAAIYYFTERKARGERSLYGRYDNDGTRKTPTLWQDDVKGYTLCNVLQRDRNSLNMVDLFGLIAQKFVLTDRAAFNAFTYNLRGSKKPAFIGMKSAGGKEHAMIVYGVRGDELEVADPNFPGDTKRRVRFDNATGEFLPYNSGSNAKKLDELFTEFYYLGLTSLVDWNTPASRWKEFDAGTIGKGIFPDYSLHALNENVEFVPLTDGFKVPDGRLSVSVRGVGFSEDWEVYNEQGVLLKRVGSAVQLPAGTKRVGIHVMDDKLQWVGFTWVNVETPSQHPFYMPPPNGKLFMSLKEDGVEQYTNPAISPTFLFHQADSMLQLNVSAPASRFLSMVVRHISGPGTYFPRGSDSVFYFDPDDENPRMILDFGEVTITKWGSDGFAGVFEFRMRRYLNMSTTQFVDLQVTGSFHYPK